MRLVLVSLAVWLVLSAPLAVVAGAYLRRLDSERDHP